MEMEEREAEAAESVTNNDSGCLEVSAEKTSESVNEEDIPAATSPKCGADGEEILDTNVSSSAGDNEDSADLEMQNQDAKEPIEKNVDAEVEENKQEEESDIGVEEREKQKDVDLCVEEPAATPTFEASGDEENDPAVQLANQSQNASPGCETNQELDDKTDTQKHTEVSVDIKDINLPSQRLATELEDDIKNEASKEKEGNLPAEQLATELAEAFTQSNQTHAESAELDEFFGTGMSLSSEATKFPALDIVDFESDDESQRRENLEEAEDYKESQTTKSPEEDTSKDEENIQDGKKSIRKKVKKEKFVELKPDIDSVNESSTQSESESTTIVQDRSNSNNNESLHLNLNNSNVDGNNEDDVEVVVDNVEVVDDVEVVVDDVAPATPENENHNNSAGGYYSTELSMEGEKEDVHPCPGLSHNNYRHTSIDAYRQKYNRPHYRGHHDLSQSSSYTQPSTQESSFADSHHYRSGNSSLYRSRELSSVDSSRLSTRSSRIERGTSRSNYASTDSSSVPRFNTLHDQQVSWLEMFKMIEAQHRTELQSQYKEHQIILRDMQRNMEKELIKQQDTLQHRLSTHREILEELSPGRQRLSAPRDRNQSHRRDLHPPHTGDRPGSESQASLLGVQVALREPAPLATYHQDYTTRKHVDKAPINQISEHDIESQPHPASVSANHSSTSVGKDKQLRGGVYSSPLPIAKVKHKNSPRASKSSEEAVQNSSCNSSRPEVLKTPSAAVKPTDSQTNASVTDSEDIMSPRSRISLGEKHAKHLSDLRSYYEEELREMRQKLSSRQEHGGAENGGVATAGERILANENAELRQRCQQMDDRCQDANIQIRDLQQKIQGLDIRASDYAERYDGAQSQVLSLSSRLEELTEFAKDKDGRVADLEAKNKRLADNLHMAHKKEKELTDSLFSAKSTIQRLVDKYETLEKDQELVKENLSIAESKLHSSREEAMDSNNKLSRIEIQVNQLQHDNDILKHELTLARSAAVSRTTYEDTYQTRGRNSPTKSTKISRTMSERSYRSRSHERRETSSELSPDSEIDMERSPIIRAEMELQKVQNALKSREFEPKLQRKYYGTEMSARNGESSGSPSKHGQHSLSSQKNILPREKRNRIPREGGNSIGSSMSRNKAKEVRLSAPSSPRNKDVNNSYKKTVLENGVGGMTSEQAMEMAKTGEVFGRPEWEDVHTSMARPHSGGSKPQTQTRDQILRERLENIENMERKYDILQNDKRKYESALSKLPSQGHRREKDRLEAELDRLDRDLGSVRMSLKRFHVLKSTI